MVFGTLTFLNAARIGASCPHRGWGLWEAHQHRRFLAMGCGFGHRPLDPSEIRRVDPTSDNMCILCLKSHSGVMTNLVLTLTSR